MLASRRRPLLLLATVGVLGAASVASPRVASADETQVRLSAESVTVDAETQAIVLQGKVDVVADPFHLTGDRLAVARTALGLVLDGAGRVGFCPCLGEPLAVAFQRATLAPPGDLFIEQPRLELVGVPVLWLPTFWIRGPDKVGLLPPEVAYRGHDGLLLGEGVHLPWRAGDEQSGLDLRAGGYVEGGAEVESTLRTPASTTTMRWDELGQSGLAVDARGSTAIEGPREATMSWDADLVRGPRGVVSTTDLDAASRVFDRAQAEASWRRSGWVMAAGAMAEDVRGSAVGEIDAWGPVVRARDSGALGEVGAYDATLEGGSLSGAGIASTSFGRADAGGLLAGRWGAIGSSLALRGLADLVGVGDDQGYDAAASARGRLALPLARMFESRDPDDPWRHRVEPEVEAAAVVSHVDDLLGEAPTPGGVTGKTWIADGGLKSALGRWGARQGLEVGVDAGAAGGDTLATSAALRWRAAASAGAFGLGAEGADVASGAAGGRGHALNLRARVGELRSLHATFAVAGRDGVDPVVARALTDAPLASSSGFLATTGWTAGGRLTVPVVPTVTLRAGVDGDLTAQKVVAAQGSIDLHDRCGCMALRLHASERLGRDGVDVWLSMDLMPRR